MKDRANPKAWPDNAAYDWKIQQYIFFKYSKDNAPNRREEINFF